MKKLALISSVIALLSFLHVATVSAGPTALSPIFGGTGISTTTGGNVGYNLYIVSVNASGVPIYGFQANGGAASGTFTNVYAGGILSVATGTASATVSLATSTLYLQFSGANCITFSTSTGAIGSTCISMSAVSTTINGATGVTYNIYAGSGLSLATGTASTTLTNIGVTQLVGGGGVTVSAATGSVTLGFTNPGFVTGASSVIWTAPQVFNATATFGGNVSTSITNSFLATNGLGIIIATATPSGGAVTINSVSSSTFSILAGQGITSTVSNASTTFTLNIGAGCTGGNFVQTISATGTITCSTPTGGSSTVLWGTAGVTTTALLNGNQTSSLDVTFNPLWTYSSGTIGFNQGSNLLLITATTTGVNSNSTGGAVNIKAAADVAGLTIWDGGAQHNNTNPFNLNCTATNSAQGCGTVIGNSTNSSPFNIQTFSWSKGGLKIDGKATGTKNANSAMLSIDRNSAGTSSAQGVRLFETFDGIGDWLGIYDSSTVAQFKISATGTTMVRGNLVDPNGNKYVTSTTAGSGTVTTSTAVSANNFPFWISDGALSGTSTLTVSAGALAQSGNFDVIGVASSSQLRSPSGTIGVLYVNQLYDSSATSTECETADPVTGLISAGNCVISLNSLHGNVIATGTAGQIQFATGTGNLVASFPTNLLFPGTINASGTITQNGTAVGFGTVATSGALTANTIPKASAFNTLANSILAESAGGIAQNGTQVTDGGGNLVGNLIQSSGANVIVQAPTGTAVLGQLAQGGAISTFSASATLTSSTFCGTGEAMAINTTSSITITVPATSTIVGFSCNTGNNKIYAGFWSQQQFANNSTNSVNFATTGDSEVQIFTAGTPTSLPPGGIMTITGLFSSSTQTQFATGTGQTLYLIYTLSQTSTPFTVSGNVVAVSSTATFNVSSTANMTGITNNGNVTTTRITASASSSIANLAIGTTTLNPTAVLSVIGNGTSSMTFGDASSTKPWCARFADFPSGTAWTYVYFTAGVMTATTTIPAAGCNFP